ncbi:MAG: hypothetical protein H6642_01025 [Caldilineaceae bacterium]|nr:hypothetical protein [Caldilineaceae bacterium]
MSANVVTSSSREKQIPASALVERFRRFLLIVSALLCVGTPVELWLADHYESPPQMIPFALCLIGLIVILWVVWKPTGAAVKTLRWVSLLLLVGSLFGGYEHLEGNIEFAREIQPNAQLADIFFEALKGADPLLAPGILGLTAILAFAATYHHPALQSK